VTTAETGVPPPPEQPESTIVAPSKSASTRRPRQTVACNIP
jgi:hypothetical protein